MTDVDEQGRTLLDVPRPDGHHDHYCWVCDDGDCDEGHWTLCEDCTP